MTDRRTTAFRWLVDVLKADPVLRRAVKTWLVWDGQLRSNVDLLAQANGATVRLTPTMEPMEPIQGNGPGGGVTYRSPLSVLIETCQIGQKVDDTLDLWGAIEQALDWPRLRGAANEAGISWWEWVQPGATAGENNVSVGTLRLVVFINR